MLHLGVQKEKSEYINITCELDTKHYQILNYSVKLISGFHHFTLISGN